MIDPSLRRFFSGNRAALKAIAATLRDAHEVRIATAYFEGAGYQVLQETLAGKRIRLLVGRPEGGEDRVRTVLHEFIQELSQGPMSQRTRAMRQLLDALEKGWMSIAVGAVTPAEAPWVDARYLYHHAKLYIADQRAAVVTSANFSYHGLCISREAAIWIPCWQMPAEIRWMTVSAGMKSCTPFAVSPIRRLPISTITPMTTHSMPGLSEPVRIGLPGLGFPPAPVRSFAPWPWYSTFSYCSRNNSATHARR